MFEICFALSQSDNRNQRQKKTKIKWSQEKSEPQIRFMLDELHYTHPLFTNNARGPGLCWGSGSYVKPLASPPHILLISLFVSSILL